jgi:hypothetical protein
MRVNKERTFLRYIEFGVELVVVEFERAMLLQVFFVQQLQSIEFVGFDLQQVAQLRQLSLQFDLELTMPD